MIQRSRLFRMGLVAIVGSACWRGPAAPVPVGGTATAAVPPRAAAPAAMLGAASGVLEASTSSAPRGVPVRRVVPAEAPPLAREFRGVWVATVSNMDWPSKRTLSTSEQQAELLALLDRAAALRLNAVVFQVRPAGDALYASKIEPWSEYLTGVQGRAPVPYWDPLEFAIREAHARGLELHAWFNPYRARHTDGRSPLVRPHIARTSPALVKKYGKSLWMDPGEAAVRARTVKVVLDVVSRYDVDGVHMDDYFYPYPVNDRRGRTVAFPDSRSWQRYRAGGGRLDRADWRRRNVDQLVEQLSGEIHKKKPWVRFGISPFGIWRPGFPASVRGFDAYASLYADARHWLREGWVDYFAPQLYWPTTKAQQSYPELLAWWAAENVHGRHLWPGNFTSLAAGRGSTAFPVSELLEQIRVTRAQEGAGGNIHFSMRSFLRNQGGMNDALGEGPYAEFALPPASPWLKAPAPSTPRVALERRGGELQLQLGASGREAPWRWLVRLRTDTAWVTMMVPGRADRWIVPEGLDPTTITVSAVNRLWVESRSVTRSVTSATSSVSAPKGPR